MAFKTQKVVLVACNLLKTMKMMQRVYSMLTGAIPPTKPRAV
jgi:hypothetical protein